MTWWTAGWGVLPATTPLPCQRGLLVERAAFLMPDWSLPTCTFLDAQQPIPSATAPSSSRWARWLKRAPRCAQAHHPCVTMVRDGGDRHGINHRLALSRRPQQNGAGAPVGLGVKRPNATAPYATDVGDE